MSGPLARRAYDLPMQPRRTRAWWLVRLELLIGIALTVLIGYLGLARALEVTFGFGDQMTFGPLQMSARVLGMITAFAIAIVGLIWMVRIIRGPRDEPPLWRHRDP
jgi:hypothetical protein